MAKKLANVKNQGPLGSLVKPPIASPEKRAADKAVLGKRQTQVQMQGAFKHAFQTTEPLDLQPTSNMGTGFPATQVDMPVAKTRAQSSLGDTRSVASQPDLVPNELGSTPGLPSGPKHRKASPLKMPKTGKTTRPESGMSGNLASRGVEFLAGVHHLTREHQGRNAAILKAYQQMNNGA